MSLRLRTVDAFTDQPFRGNPAGVIRLDDRAAPASDDWYRSVARELNLSETAFLEPYDGADADYRLRWFTPGAEVDLCGHATLAMSHCLFADGIDGPIRYATRSGVLVVGRTADGAVTMDFPARPPRQIPVPDWLPAALGCTPTYYGDTPSGYVLAHLERETDVRAARPDLVAIEAHLDHGLIITAAAEADDTDFVSRFFAPAFKVPEDPVTGSAHTVLAPYWAGLLGRTELHAEQVSARGGRLELALAGDRVLISGRAVTMIDGTLAVDPA